MKAHWLDRLLYTLPPALGDRVIGWACLVIAGVLLGLLAGGA